MSGPVPSPSMYGMIGSSGTTIRPLSNPIRVPDAGVALCLLMIGAQCRRKCPKKRRLRACQAPKRRIHVWVIRPEPVAKAAPDELTCRNRRGAFQHVMLAVEE